MIIKRGEPCSSSRIDLQLTKSPISVFLSLEKAVLAALTTVVERFTRPTEHEGRPRRKPRANSEQLFTPGKRKAASGFQSARLGSYVTDLKMGRTARNGMT